MTRHDASPVQDGTTAASSALAFHGGLILARDRCRFVKDEASQEDQFAYHAAREAAGTSFTLKGFMDGMMRFGPVPVRHYRPRHAGQR
jgi:hypothetical protein